MYDSWEYTKAVVEDFLPNSENIISAIAEQDALDGYIYSGAGTWQTEADESLSSTIVEFFAETLLLSQPIAAMFLQKAQIAYSAGYLPSLGSSTASASATLGLDNVEENIDTALDILERATAMMLSFHDMEKSDPGNFMTDPLAYLFDRPIPQLSLLAMEDIHGDVVTNDYTSVRAMVYPRLGDYLELYRSSQG